MHNGHFEFLEIRVLHLACRCASDREERRGLPVAHFAGDLKVKPVSFSLFSSVIFGFGDLWCCGEFGMARVSFLFLPKNLELEHCSDNNVKVLD
jgi:hypothetical protein